MLYKTLCTGHIMKPVTPLRVAYLPTGEVEVTLKDTGSRIYYRSIVLFESAILREEGLFRRVKDDYVD